MSSGAADPLDIHAESRGEGRIRAAKFPARKSLEEFDFDHARGLKADPSSSGRSGQPGTPRPAPRPEP
jgi:hypothetical protein